MPNRRFATLTDGHGIYRDTRWTKTPPPYPARVRLEVRDWQFGEHIADIVWDERAKGFAATESLGWFLKSNCGLAKKVHDWLSNHGARRPYNDKVGGYKAMPPKKVKRVEVPPRQRASQERYRRAWQAAVAD